MRRGPFPAGDKFVDKPGRPVKGGFKFALEDYGPYHISRAAIIEKGIDLVKMELEEALDRLFCVLNAVELMALGLEVVQSPYSDGFYVVFRYLENEEQEVRKRLEAVSAARGAA